MSELITGIGVNDAMAEIRKNMTLPINPHRALEKVQSMRRSAADGSGIRAASDMAKSTAERMANFRGASGRHSSVNMVLEKPRSPLDRFNQASLPHDIADYAQRIKVRELCRTYYKIHNLIPLLIDIYCRFPIQGMSIDHPDPDLKQFYEELFLDDLDYEEFLIDFGREFFTIGEVNSVGSFSELLGIWEHEQIIDPDDLTVSLNLHNEQRYHMRVPAHIRAIVETMEPRSDYKMLKEEYPEYVQSVQRERSGMLDNSATGPGLEISTVLLSRLINKTFAGDLYGTPHMLRVFQNLNLEEGLMASQKAIADRLYSPLILAKLGDPNGLDGGPWMPMAEEIEAFSDLMQQAMTADFRFLTYHYGLDISSVFGQESVPNLDADFERIERKILQSWGIGESLISGSSDGSYASSALNSELVNQLMSSYQKFVKKHFKKRCEVVAEVQGHFETETRGGQSYPIIQEYLEVNPETGEELVKKRPKLAIPQLNFKSIALRDEQSERDFLLQLQQSGIPISNRTLLETVDIDFEEEIEQIAEEKADKIIAQQELLQKVIDILQKRGLPLTPELLTLVSQQVAPVPGPPQMSMGLGSDITAPINTPALTNDPNAMAVAQQDAMTLPVMPDGAGQAPAPGAPAGPPAAPPAPGGALLPRNQLAQQPEISSQQAAGMPRRSFMRHDPSHIGKSSMLKEETIEKLVRERPWTRSLGRNK